MTKTAMRRLTGLPVVWLALQLAGCTQLAPVTRPPLAAGGDQDSGDGALSQLVGVRVAATAGPVAPTPVTLAATPVAAPPIPTAGGPPTIAVRRGPIAETVQFDGRVAGLNEAPLGFQTRVMLDRVAVKQGQQVEAQQVLAEADAKDTTKSLSAARATVEASVLQVGQVRQQAEARIRAAETEAADAVRRATAEDQRVKAGAASSERQTVDGAVVNARANLERVEADLARLKAGPSEIDVRAAEQQLTDSRLALRSAQAEWELLKRGADPVALATAEREVASAAIVFTTAQADLARLTAGPDPYELRSAQRVVERAQIDLKAAESLSGDDRSRASAIAGARLTLADAKDRLTKVSEPPSPETVAAARYKVDQANAGVEAAQREVEALRKGPDQLTLDKASATVKSAESGVAASDDKLRKLRAGPSDDQVKSASDAVESARIALGIAEAVRDEVKSHPTDAELDESQRRLADAQAALERIRNTKADADPEFARVQRELEQNRRQVQTLEADLEATRLRAPSSGTIVAVQAAAGEAVEAGRPVIVLATQGDPIVLVTMADDRASSRVTAGQKATVQIDGGDGVQLNASVDQVADGVVGGGRAVQLQVAWGSRPALYGATALVRITLQQKPDALLIPRAAVRSSSGGTYVDYVENGAPKSVTVELGITTSTDVEVLSGLGEGQEVIARSAAPASSRAATPGLPRPTPVP